MNGGVVGLGKLSKKKLIELVKLNPYLIWELPSVDERVFKAAIKSDPMVVFDKSDRLHHQFDLKARPELLKLIFKSMSEKSGKSIIEIRRWCSLICTDWRILAFIPNAHVEIQIRLARINILALEFVNENRIPEIAMNIIRSVNDIDELLDPCCCNYERVVVQVKRILLWECNSGWFQPEETAPYTNRYVSLATEMELDRFISDERLSYLISETKFTFDPPEKIKRILIKRKGFRYYINALAEKWTLSKELSLWVASRLNEDSKYELPDILEMPFPGFDEKMVFVSALLGIQFSDAEFNNSELIAAIDLIKPKMHCEKIAWLCWAFGIDASDAVARLLVAKLSGLSASDCGHLSIKDRNRALGRLAKHYSDQDIRAALLIIGKVFPEIALLQASV